MKTIGFMISNQHLIPHGGIGQFCLSFRTLCKNNNYQFILITDRKPKKGFVDIINADWVFYPDKPISYDEHRKKYGRFEEGVCYEKIKNFDNALLKASNLFDLDVIIANSHESLASLADSKINAKKVLYTHLYKQIYPEVKYKSIFNDEYHNYFQQFLHRPDVWVGTQSVHNKDMLLAQGIKNVDVLPMPITEPALLESSDNMPKSGALFIGRWEGGKNPTDYIKLVKELELYPKVMTNKTGAEKFAKAFNEVGIKDYDIRAGIIGQEKVDFIKSCKLFLNTSLVECYPNAVIETLGHMEVLVLDKVKVPWPKNFSYVHTINARKPDHSLIGDIIHNKTYLETSQLQYIQELHELSHMSWKLFIER
jgi:hypothetical protein